jgi:hypothetical protein
VHITADLFWYIAERSGALAGPHQNGQSGRDPRVGGDAHRMDRAEIPELRPFVRDGKLVQIPRNRSKRLLLLDYLAQLFNPGQHYTEVEVNKALGAVHSDFAALRRYLVDDGFLDRESGQYWRSGGTVT